MKSIFKEDYKCIKDKVITIEGSSPFRNQPDFDISDNYFEKILETKLKSKKKEFNPKLYSNGSGNFFAN